MRLFEITTNPEDVLEERLPQIKEKLKRKFGKPLGEGRNRVVYGSKSIVYKVPKNGAGIGDNLYEEFLFNKYKQYKELAKSKIIYIHEIPVLLMERLDTETKEDKPEWADFYDMGQVGRTKKGEWRAYDYGIS